MHRHQQDVIAYLVEENRVLKEQLRGRKLRLTDDQRRRLAVKAKCLGRRALDAVATLVTPDTLMRWHRRLIAWQWTYAARRVGRPGVRKVIAALIVRLARENDRWGYCRIQGELRKRGHRVAASTIGKVLKDHGIRPALDRPTSWRTFLRAHWGEVAGMDFVTTDVWTPLEDIARGAHVHAGDEPLRQFLGGVHLTRREPVDVRQVTNGHRPPFEGRPSRCRWFPAPGAASPSATRAHTRGTRAGSGAGRLDLAGVPVPSYMTGRALIGPDGEARASVAGTRLAQSAALPQSIPWPKGIPPRAATPAGRPTGGLFHVAPIVGLGCDTEGSTIVYTTELVAPFYWRLYTGPFRMRFWTLRVRCGRLGHLDSEVVAYDFDIE